MFVGRRDQLKALAEVVGTARTGPAGANVVGEPGSGKSRLLAEAEERAAHGGRLAVVGYEPERNVPLAAAASLLRRLSRVPRHGARLEALLLGPEEPGALQPVRFFEAAHRAFRTFERARLVIDDLH